MQPAAKRGLLIFVVGVLLLGGALWFTYWRQSQLSIAEQLAPVAIGGDFTLVDQNGVTRHAADFRGKLMLVYFGYTYCPDACPTALQDMSQAIDLLGEKGAEVQPIFITVDPDARHAGADEALCGEFPSAPGGADGHAGADRRRRPRLSRLLSEGEAQQPESRRLSDGPLGVHLSHGARRPLRQPLLAGRHGARRWRRRSRRICERGSSSRHRSPAAARRR